LKPIQSVKEHIKVLRVGDVLDVAQTKGNVLDIYLGRMSGVAELASLMVSKELSVD